jgi:cupin fold WbuC family metalloprotein
MKIFSSQYFDELLNIAARSQRLRAHANVHHSYADQCQKLFNAIKLDSYIRPHRHSLDPKEECLLAVRGLFGLIEFNDEGGITSIVLFGSEKYSEQFSIAAGVELSAGVWHTVVALVDQAVLFEVKNGPFNPVVAKEFATWAPEEGGNQARSYLNVLKRECFAQLPADFCQE